MDIQTITPHEMGQSITDFGFLVMAGASYLLFSGTVIILFIRWFVRIINTIINKHQHILDEVLKLQKEILMIVKSEKRFE